MFFWLSMKNIDSIQGEIVFKKTVEFFISRRHIQKSSHIYWIFIYLSESKLCFLSRLSNKKFIDYLVYTFTFSSILYIHQCICVCCGMGRKRINETNNNYDIKIIQNIHMSRTRTGNADIGLENYAKFTLFCSSIAAGIRSENVLHATENIYIYFQYWIRFGKQRISAAFKLLLFFYFSS